MSSGPAPLPQGLFRLDAHQHFWRYDGREFSWLSGALASLRRDWLPPELEVAQRAAGVCGTVAVEARQLIEETEWLLELARGNPRIEAVVGWLPIISPEFPRLLDHYLPNRKLSGLRHVLQGENDDYMLSPAFHRGIEAITARGLVYDLLVYDRQLPSAIRLVDAHPNQVFILDHIAKPRIREGILEPWASLIRELSRRPNVWVKVSGLVTEADPGAWTPADLCPFWETALDAFGPGRLLFGSDWPVCEASGGYGAWVAALAALSCDLGPGEQLALWGDNARKAYLRKEMPS